MQKMLFVSDIMGTIDEADNEKLENFFNLIIMLGKKQNADEIIFSLCTSDSNEKYLLEYIRKIIPFLKKYHITLGRQYMSGQYLENNEFVKIGNAGIIKTKEINDYSGKIKSHDKLVAIYYADDHPSKEAIDGSLKNNLTDSFYHLLVPYSNRDASEFDYSSSTLKNIDGILKAIEYHLQTIKSNNIDEKKY